MVYIFFQEGTLLICEKIDSQWRELHYLLKVLKGKLLRFSFYYSVVG